ncbi:MAG: aldose 1-epimerase family protein [Armatimonadota bacterium]
MPALYGKQYDQTEMRKRVGSMDQIGGVRRVELADGNERGVEAFDFRTGSGLDYTVLAGRGMDIGAVNYRSYPLAWLSPTGVPAASFFEPEGLGWLRSFHGGLISTCGLTYAGAPSTDDDEQLGLHGRVSNIPAKNLSWGASWHDESYVLMAQGEVRETSVFGPNVLMTRRVSSFLGYPMLHVQDVVENQGFSPQEHMLVYHCNLGFPLMDEGTQLLAPSAEVRGQTDFAQETIDTHTTFEGPGDVDERVYYHTLNSDDEGNTMVAVINRDLGAGIGLALTYNTEVLPNLVQWKMPGQTTYVMGIEPANCLVEGRPTERERGTLVELEPGESRTYDLRFEVYEGPDAIEQLEGIIDSLG